MCGISGIFSSQYIDRQILPRMVDKLRHRGPDADGVFYSSDGSTALGHNRLKVIDLSTAANQPMLSADGRFVIVFNGEIYNYKALRHQLQKLDSSIHFRTHSDTETILYAFAQWGPEMVHRLDGMFALAIFDQNLQSLFLCRDRAGKKPLYFYHDNTQFVFASELKAFREHPITASLQVNQDAIKHFLHLGYVPGPHTIFDEIKKLPAGSWALIDKSQSLKIQRYWRVEHEAHSRSAVSPAAVKEKLKAAIEQAVQKRLISDVPLGAFLSGGTDSSLVAALAARSSSSSLKTFTIGFADRKFNESHYAQRVAKHLKTDHRSYILSEMEAVELVDESLTHFDEPFADTSAIPTMLVSRLAKKEVSVCLTGDGGDELFQGYGAYRWANRLDTWPLTVAGKPMAWMLSHSGINRLVRAGLMLDRAAGNSYSHIFSQEQNFFSQHEILDRLLVNSEAANWISYTPPAPIDSLSAGERQAFFDFNYYLCDDLLVKVDRASMRYALECRCPLLDREVVSLAASLPLDQKRKGKISKWILKEILSEHLPHDLVHRGKWGFSVPLARWLKGDLSYLVDKFLSDEVIDEIGLFNKAYVNTLKRQFFLGRDFLFNRLWVIIVIHKWMKENCKP